MSDAKICVCPQCGKKFKLKADFAAASFACSGCGATVWVEGKPKGPATTGRSTAGRKRSAGTRKRSGARSGGGGGGAAAGRGKRRGRQRPEAPVSGEDHHASRQHFGKQDNTQNMIFAGVGLVVVIGAIAFFVMSQDKEPPAEPPIKTATGGQDPITDEPPIEVPDENPETTAENDGGTEETANGGAEETDEPAKKKTKPLKTTKSKTRIDPKTGRKVRISKWNPPDDIGHLESTSAEQRKEIDELLVMMFDPYAGRDSIDAKPKLALIGKPAYLPILAAMVKAKANFKWDNQHDDNVNMSSVKLADECLRMMDGYLEANGIGVIRPGTDETYYGYVVRMHYKRWKKTLEALDEMPGPFDPSGEYEEETEKVD